jgi:diguanylate cyclase (GGDEF)-like protein
MLTRVGSAPRRSTIEGTFLVPPRSLAGWWCLARRAVMTVVAAIFWTQVAYAAGDESVIALGESLAHSPRGVLLSAEARLEQARLVHDRRAEMIALRDRIEARTTIGGQSGDPGDIARGMAIAQDLNDEESLCMFMLERSSAPERQGDWAGAAIWVDKAIDLARSRKLDAVLANAYARRGEAELHQAHGAESLIWLKKAYSLYEAQGDRLGMSEMLVSIAAAIRAPTTASAQDLAQAADYIQRAIDLLDPQRHQATLMMYLDHLALTKMRMHEPKEAEALLRRAIRQRESGAYSTNDAVLDYRLGTALLAQGQAAEALSSLKASLPMLRSGNTPTLYPQALMAEARALAKLQQRDESLAALKAAKLRVDELKIGRLSSDYYTAAAEVQSAFGDYRQANEMLRQLLVVERESALANNRRVFEDAKVSFAVDFKERENALLKAREVASENRRMALLLALTLAAALLVGGALFLWLQIRQRRRFADLAMRDELTGAPNRRCMLEQARHALDARRRYDDRLWVAILDIDHFKSFNDRFGHDIGDAVLREFYSTCRRHLRTSDALGRWGGEEFLLISRELDADAVGALFERLLHAVGECELPGVPMDVRISFSMGACEMGGASQDAESVIKLADEALYEAKAAGRRQCSIADANPNG